MNSKVGYLTDHSESLVTLQRTILLDGALHPLTRVEKDISIHLDK